MLPSVYLRLSRLLPFSRSFSAFPYFSESEEEPAEPFAPAATESIYNNLLKREKKFLDYLTTNAIAGKGGDGCYTFTRTRGVRRAFPAGGNGAPGGDVWIEATPDAHCLLAPHTIEAECGESGKGKDMDGRRGKDFVLKVPLGTLVYETAAYEKRRLLFDLDTPQKVIVAKGGAGGRGNKMYSRIIEREPGKPGESKKLALELKLIADIGFVGYPNVGKTSLLAALTRACPTIASYPFTTLHPYVGTLKYVDGFKLTIADMPGLIEGAHANKGLGHDFLKHIQRTKALVYILDPTSNLLNDLLVLYDELKRYDSKLVRKPYTVIINKSDLITETERTQVEELREKLGIDVVQVSAKHGSNLSPLVDSFRKLVERLRPKKSPPASDYDVVFSDSKSE